MSRENRAPAQGAARNNQKRESKLYENSQADNLRQSKSDRYSGASSLLLSDYDSLAGAYDAVLWLYCEAVARCRPERREELLSLELPFLLSSEIFVDVEYRVGLIVRGLYNRKRRSA